MREGKLALVVSVCAIVTSVSSVGIATFQAAQARIHNRKSVTPALALVRYGAGTDPRMGIAVENRGVGPAVLRSIEVSLDGRAIPATDRESGPWLPLMAAAGINRPDNAWQQIAAGTYLRPGERYWLLWRDLTEAERRDPAADRVAEFRSALMRIGIAISYESVYGDEFSARLAP